MSTNTAATKKSAFDLLAEDVKKVLNELPSKSAKIRFLNAMGMGRGDISRVMEIRYQHVRNVLISPVKNDNSQELAENLLLARKSK